MIAAFALLAIGAAAPNLEYRLKDDVHKLDALRGSFVLVLTGLGTQDAALLDAISKLDVPKAVRVLPLAQDHLAGFAVADLASREPFGGDSRRATLINPGGRVVRSWQDLGEAFPESLRAWMADTSLPIGASGIDPRPVFADAGQLAGWTKPEGEKGLLVLFLASRGPVDSLYAGRLKQIGEACTAAGIGVIGLFSAYDETVSDVAAAKSAFEWQFDCVVDSGSGFADVFRATRTPEAFLMDASGRILYTGAIDSSTFDRDTNSKYLLDAIKSVTESKAPTPAKTMPFGTRIRRSSADDRSRY